MIVPRRSRNLITSSKPDGRHRTSVRPLLAALGLGLLALMAVALAGAQPADAANATPSPFEQGRHIYDYGKILSDHSLTTAEALAAHIEAGGGGRVVVYTTDDSSSVPSTLAKDWNVDGLLLTAQGDFGQMAMGATLKGKLTSTQLTYMNSYFSSGPATSESWILSDLARVDGFISGTHVFDGAGVLDAAHKQQAETATTNLASQLGGTIYVDIAIGGDDPSTTAFFNGASHTEFGKALLIAFAVTGNTIGGYIYENDLFGSYNLSAPWGSGNSIENETAPNGDVQAALLGAIDAVQKPPLISSDAIPVIVFVVVVVIFSITAPFLWGPWLIRKLAGVSGPIKGGLPSEATIQSIADTGVTVTMSGVGPEAPDYKLGLLVDAVGGGVPYEVTVKTLVPRIFIPMIVPGARIGVIIDPANPQKVAVDFSRIGGGGSAAGSGAAAGGAIPPGGFGMNFDASGQPAAADVAALAGGVRSGAVTQHTGSADQLLATGTHGTAVITTAQPLGKKVRDINPHADSSRLDDPVWLFTVEVSLAGQAPFPAVFGHRVPLAKVAEMAPGVKLAVAVDESDKNEEVAIDWDRSPIG